MFMLDRRMLLRAGSAAVGAAALAPTTPALAHAPQAGERAQPSFYRLKLGAIEITVVSDGTLAFPAETLWGDRAEDARGLLTSTFHTPRPVGLQINTVLVNTGEVPKHTGHPVAGAADVATKTRHNRKPRIRGSDHRRG